MASHGAFSNPLFDVLALTMIGSNLAQSNKAAQAAAMQPDPQELSFANAAYQTGQMVDQVPRQPGLFSNLGVRMHLLSPNVSPRSKDIAGELNALTERRKQQMDIIGHEIDWWNKVGTKNFDNLQDMPSLQQINMFAAGGRIPTTEGTVRERAIEQVGQGREFAQRQALIRDGLSVFNSNLRLKAFNAKAAEPVPGTQRYRDEKNKVAFGTAYASSIAKAQAEGDNFDVFFKAHPNAQIRNKVTMEPVDLSGYANPRSAIADPRNRVTYTAQSAKDADSAAQRVSDLKDFRDNILPHILINSEGMTNLARTTAIKANWLEMTAADWGGNPYMSEWHKRTSMAMQFGHGLQGRFANLPEVYAIQEGNLPSLKRDDLQMGRQKVDEMIKTIMKGAGFAMDNNEKHDAAASAKSDFFADIGGGASGPEETRGEGMSRIAGEGGEDIPEMPEVPGMSEVERIATSPDEGTTGGEGGTP